MRQETVSAAQIAASEVSIFKAAEVASPTSEVKLNFGELLGHVFGRGLCN